MNITLNWESQFLIAAVIFISYFLFLLWIYEGQENSKVCRSESFSAWTQPYILLVTGGALGQTIVYIFRTLVQIQGYSLDGKLRHPNAAKLMMLMTTIQSFTLVCTYKQYISFTCEDFLGVRTSPFMWWEWLTTVPSVFFLISMLDAKRQVMNLLDIRIEFLGGSAIFLLFLCNLSLPLWMHMISFGLANVCMVYAVVLQQLTARSEYLAARQAYDHVFDDSAYCGLNTDKKKETFDTLQIAQCKMNIACFITFIYSLFPLIYYAKVLDVIDHDTSYVLTFTCALFSHILFVQIVSDSHVNILDPSKFLLLEEKKKAEESRSMFLRYVFHEVRVPLHSVMLGLQLLQDSRSLSSEERETLGMIREATGFMAGTLNDVLSLQKIEEGKLELEYKPFSPHKLALDVLNNFR